MAEQASYVYFAQAEDFVKIGFSTNPRKRIATMYELTFSPFGRSRPGYRVLAIIPGTLADERTLHRRFAEYRSSDGSEWFRACAPLIQFVETLPNKVPLASLGVQRFGRHRRDRCEGTLCSVSCIKCRGMFTPLGFERRHVMACKGRDRCNCGKTSYQAMLDGRHKCTRNGFYE